MKPIYIDTPLTEKMKAGLKAGDEILLSGTIITARDAAHKRFIDLMGKGRRLPIGLKGAIIYYCGPTPAAPGRAIGSCGPTTSARMDKFTPSLIKSGLGGMIGKGDRSQDVVRAIKKYKCVYFIATGGIGALLSTKVKSARAVLFHDLGPEAVYRLEVKDFPVTVGIDTKGKSIYGKAGRKKK